jgi:uncharacterized protein YndB with AHSA1/START domain
MTDGAATGFTIRREITVEASPERAFAVFTGGQSGWWPRTHHIGAQPMEEAVIEPRAGGRWFERGADGTECDWGHVRVWQPPERLVLVWRITGEWAYDEALDTELEVRFLAEGPRRTRVELEHRGLDALDEQARATLGSPGGWPGLLARFAAAAEQT